MSAHAGIAPIEPRHWPAILELNHRFVHWLSPLDEEGLRDLLGHCTYARQAHDGRAFLLGYDGNSPYRHKNVDWLSERLRSYAYIDRIVVAPEFAGKGLGRRLYDDFTNWARDTGHDTIACEVNTKPDNPASHAFHRNLGFDDMGEAEYGRHEVQYYQLRL